MDIYGSYGMTLTLLDDVKEGLCTTNCNCVSVTIDLNGHTLDITRLYANGDYLNIIDSSEGKTGKLIVERFDVETPAENNAVIEGNVITLGDDYFTNNGLVEYVDGGFINNGDFITSWTWADDHSSATLRINHEDLDAVVTNEDTTPATCIASGVRTYTAAATYRDRNYADTKDEEIAIDPNAHSYTNNTLTASPVEDGLYAYACDNGCGTHTDDHIIKDFNGEGNHLELTKDGEGNYSTSENIILADANGFASPIDFTAASVTYNRNIVMDDGMYSFIVPFDIPADQAAELGTFYQYSKHEEGKVYFDDITKIDNADGIVRANTAYFFEPAKDITSITVENPTFGTTGTMPDATNPSEPGLYGTYSQIDIPVGAYGYAMHDGQSTFVKAGTGNLLRSFRAYLWLGSGASMAKALAFFGDYDDITGINNIETDTDLDMSKPIYTLSGQRIMTPKKGEIYIQNGKKVIKK